MAVKKKTSNKAKKSTGGKNGSSGESAVALAEETSELNLPVWALINGIKCFASGLTYDQAVGKRNEFSDAAIVTDAVASRLGAVS